MKKTTHSLLLALSALLLVSGARSVLYAQCNSEPTEIPWPVPPAIGGQDGDDEGGTGIVFVGERNTGNIQKWSLSAGSLQQAGVLSPGTQLPADVKGIWSIAVPQKDLVIALVTYDDAGTERYGILRSEDLGENWTLLKPDAFKDPQFVSLEGVKGGTSSFVDFTGNYWRAALLEQTWLEDGTHGWVWGRKGILSTTDAGLTWSVAYKTDSPNNQSYSNIQGVWGLAFENPSKGVAIIGPASNLDYYTTENGGQAWTKTKSLQTYRVADFAYKKGEYRALLFNRFDPDGANAFLHVSTNGGANWAFRGASAAIAASETVTMVETLWPNKDTAFLIYRQGEIRMTTNAGENWTTFQTKDASYPAVRYGDGTGGAPYAGYGQSSVLVRDDFGDAYIVQVHTNDCTGEVDTYLPRWPVGVVSGVPTEVKPLPGFAAFPNPTSDRCEVRFALNAPETAGATVVDSRGNVVRSLDFGPLETGDHVKSVDLSNLPSGSYRVMVRAGEQRAVESVVVER